MITDGMKDASKGAFKNAALIVIGSLVVYFITKMWEKYKG